MRASWQGERVPGVTRAFFSSASVRRASYGAVFELAAEVPGGARFRDFGPCSGRGSCTDRLPNCLPRWFEDAERHAAAYPGGVGGGSTQVGSLGQRDIFAQVHKREVIPAWDLPVPRTASKLWAALTKPDELLARCDERGIAAGHAR